MTIEIQIILNKYPKNLNEYRLSALTSQTMMSFEKFVKTVESCKYFGITVNNKLIKLSKFNIDRSLMILLYFEFFSFVIFFPFNLNVLTTRSLAVSQVLKVWQLCQGSARIEKDIITLTIHQRLNIALNGCLTFRFSVQRHKHSY